MDSEQLRHSRSANINAVFYADSYHPIQAGSIDGTDITPHDNGVYRALICAAAGLYDPANDPKIIGDPYCTVFVGHLSHSTTEDSLKEAMSKYGRVKKLRIVRHIVTGASQGYAFVEYEKEREMRHAYEVAHHTIIDGSQVVVDYSRQQLMPGWIPRRLGGGVGGKKESGQLRFGGRERPFRAPLRPIPHDELGKLGIPLPPEGHYLSRFEIPPLPRRPRTEARHRGSAEHRNLGHNNQAVDIVDPIDLDKEGGDLENVRESDASEKDNERHETKRVSKQFSDRDSRIHLDSGDSDHGSIRRKRQYYHHHRIKDEHLDFDDDNDGSYARNKERHCSHDHREGYSNSDEDGSSRRSKQSHHSHKDKKRDYDDKNIRESHREDGSGKRSKQSFHTHKDKNEDYDDKYIRYSERKRKCKSYRSDKSGEEKYSDDEHERWSHDKY